MDLPVKIRIEGTIKIGNSSYSVIKHFAVLFRQVDSVNFD